MKKNLFPILTVILAIALIVVGVLFYQERQANADARASIDALSGDVDNKAQMIESLNADVAAKTSEIESLSADVAIKASEIEALTTDMVNQSSEIEALNADVANQASEIEELSADVANKASEIEALSADVANKTSEIEGLNADIAAKNIQIDSLSADVSSKNAEIDALNQDVDALTAQIEALQQANPEAVVIPRDVPGAYRTTREFLYRLDQGEIRYTYLGVDNDGDDAVQILTNVAGHEVTIRIWFTQDCEHAIIRIWDVIAFDSGMFDHVMDVCNELNCTYKYATFTVDSDSTVTERIDAIFREGDNVGEIVMESLYRTLSILQEAYPVLLPFES